MKKVIFYFKKNLRNQKCKKFKNNRLHFLKIELYFKKNYKISKYLEEIKFKKNILKNFRI